MNNNKKIISKVFIYSFLLLLLLVFSYQAQASSIGIPDTSDNDLNSFIILAINISKYILGIVGSLTLLMFVIGGVQFMISAGSTEAVGKAKKTITAAVVGLLIVFSSWLIINFVIQSLGVNPTDGKTSPSGSSWKWNTVPQAEKTTE